MTLHSGWIVLCFFLDVMSIWTKHDIPLVICRLEMWRKFQCMIIKALVSVIESVIQIRCHIGENCYIYNQNCYSCIYKSDQLSDLFFGNVPEFVFETYEQHFLDFYGTEWFLLKLFYTTQIKIERKKQASLTLKAPVTTIVVCFVICLWF